jgi:hypothetical protein
MADRRNSNPEPYDTYTSSPLWNDIAGGLNQLGNPLKSIGGRVLNQWNKFGNYLGVNALDIGTDANTPYRTNYPEGNLKNTIKGLMNPNFNPQTGRNFPVVSMPLPGQAPNMGNSVGTPAEQAEFIKEYNRTATPAPAGPPAGLLNNQQFQDKYGPGQSGLNIGTRVATQKNQEGLFNGTLDKIFKNPVLGRMMEASLYTKPSFQSGFGADVQGMAEGEVALRAVEADEAERISKEAIAKAKNTKDPRDLMAKEPVMKIYNRVQGNRMVLEKTTAMAKLLDESNWVTGGPASALKFLRGAAKLAGVNLETSNLEEIKIKLARVYAQQVKSGTYGRDASPSDYENIIRTAGDPGATTSRAELRATFADAQKSISREINNDSSYLRALGIDVGQIESYAPPKPRYSRQRNP